MWEGESRGIIKHRDFIIGKLLFIYYSLLYNYFIKKWLKYVMLYIVFMTKSKYLP